MIKKILFLFLIGIMLATMVAGCSVLETPEEASGPIEAIPVEVEEERQEPAPTEVSTATPAEEKEEPASTEVVVDEPESSATSTPEATEVTITPEVSEEEAGEESLMGTQPCAWAALF